MSSAQFWISMTFILMVLCISLGSIPSGYLAGSGSKALICEYGSGTVAARWFGSTWLNGQFSSGYFRYIQGALPTAKPEARSE